jgi:hypothetical protein
VKLQASCREFQKKGYIQGENWIKRRASRFQSSVVSRAGACLTVDAPAALPTEFMLHLSADLHCWYRVVWRKDSQVGVEFEATPVQYLDWFKDQRTAQATGDT